MICPNGRPVTDGRLANPVRSGRKQPQRVSARVVSPVFHPHSFEVRRAGMASTLFGTGNAADDDQPRDEGLPEPPPAEGPGLFGRRRHSRRPAPARGPAAARRRHALSRPRPQIPPLHLRRADRPGRPGPHPPQRLRPRPRRPRLHAHRRPRRRQDHHRPHHRPRAQLRRPRRHRRPDTRALRHLSGMPRHPRRPPPRRGGDGRRQQQQRRRRPRAARGRALPPGPGALPDHHPGRGAHALDPGLQRAAQDPGGAAARGEVPLRHHRTPQGPGDHPLALPDLPPEARAPGRAARPLRRHRRQGACRSGARGALHDRPRRRRQRPRRPFAAGPGHRPRRHRGGRRGHRGVGAQHARPGRPRPGAGPHGSRDGRRHRRRALPDGPRPRARRRPAGGALGPPGAHPHPDPPPQRPRPSRRPVAARRTNAAAAPRSPRGSRSRCWAAPGRCCSRVCPKCSRKASTAAPPPRWC